MPDRVILIAAVTVDGYIARHNLEITNWSQDLKLFKDQTMGCPVIMGSNTFKCMEKPLTGRKVIVAHRNDKPKDVLKDLSVEKCFIAGGGKTNARFSDLLTHAHLTPHPLIFGGGIPLFSEPIKEKKLVLKKKISVVPDLGIYQYQYKIVHQELEHK